MSLYRIWRPKTFTDLVGQDAVVRTLSSALESGRLAHAYLFSGPRGSGKTSAAKILARCINCAAGPTPAPDNTCENCQAILSGTALDVLEIDAASNRGIDEIRALREAVKFAPSVMRKKVYIVDEAHMLTKEGANAFLKTLEEPPPHAVFILATTEPEKLPPTILSRCQRYAFRRIAIPIMIERMRAIATGEKIEIDDQALSAIAYRADGGLRDALTMLEQAASFAEGAVSAQTIDLAFGVTGRNYARTLVDSVIAHDAAAMLKTIDEASDAGTDMQVLIRTLIGEFRNLLVGRIDPKLLARDLAPEDAQAAVARSAEISQAQVIRALRLLTESLATARTSGHPRLELESALLRFVLAAEDPTLDALSARVTALEGGTQAVAAPRAEKLMPARPVAEKHVAEKPAAAKLEAKMPAVEKPAPERTSANGGPLSLQKIRASWSNVRMRIESERMPLRAPLSRALLDALDGNVLTIKLPSEFEADILRGEQKLIEHALADVVGEPVKVSFRVDGGGSARGSRAPQPAQPADNPADLLQYANERIR
ncbi:MAG: DNA polymerase III subunit gamma/tau [Candidatus Eremiobacteraeota bacterium]|nr:DNA polymerase III subunit gamma/tau [Candidatus Eremiobacteraeota bacterium]